MSRLLACVLAVSCLAARGAAGNGAEAGAPLRIDLAEDERWEAVPAEGVELQINAEPTRGGEAALRLSFDFHGRAGWAAARLPFAPPLALPENWELRFRLRGDAPPNHLEIKLVDPSGENVWWSVRRDYDFPREWTPLRVKKRQVEFAWGPAGGGEITRLGALEVTVTAGSGGSGRVWIADLELAPLPPARPYAGTPRAEASAELPGHFADAALDGDRATAWRAPGGEAAWTVDFGEPRELGGLTLHWEEGRAPRRFAVELSDDGAAFQEVYAAPRAGSERSDLFLPETETRFVRLRLAPEERERGLAEVEVRRLAFGASRNAFFETIAREAPRGTYPRGFSGEQVYWTVAGAAGAPEEVLVSEDGAVELGERAPSLEPFLHLDGRLWSWADVKAEQSLADGDLPIPTIAWTVPGVRLEVTTLAVDAGAKKSSGKGLLAVRYRLRNSGEQARAGTFSVVARPFQVNPPMQFLNVAGGVARLERVRCAGMELVLDERRLRAAPPPDACGAAVFDEGPVTHWLRRGEAPESAEVVDAAGLASADLTWSFDLLPGQSREIVLGAPLDGETGAMVTAESFAIREAETLAVWRERLGRVELRVPAAAAPLVRSLRTGLAAILVHRDGPALQPGSRAYARSWIRDGALTGTALLRLGHADVAREFAEWYAGFQYPDGKVPCCVDRRGADPVPENDSHGQWIHLVREVYRHTRDRRFAERMFPGVERAVAYLDALRASRRTAEFERPEKRVFFGLLPESISHEGYSAKPMHSYWDDAFGYRGYADAVELAAALGRGDLAARWAASRDEFRADLATSLARAMALHRIEHLPGAAELGDFDPTSSTILVEPGGLRDALPPGALAATFERYFREAEERRDGRRRWEVYTPYELRNVGTFVRLGRRDRAHLLLDFFLAGRRPAAWNQWAEVVARAERAPRFLGDMPHGWVASDFIRSLLDLFAYERREDGALVLAAGVPREWLAAGEEIGVRGLVTPWGELSYSLRREGERVRVRIGALAARPPGGVVLALPDRAPLAVAALPAELAVELPR
ncbi:MAG TPA: discoidin domain-containing protein [Thermoanaerobaculia bacterium]|nr:discoidin domain-containing protein [Thermoanaerobaculia bacterium]